MKSEKVVYATMAGDLFHRGQIELIKKFIPPKINDFDAKSIAR